jgi:S1-C subfamily serine protease
VSWVDLLVLAWVAVSGLIGFQRGLVAQLLSLLGLALGALAGSRLAPYLLADGRDSPWVPFASLIGAVVGAVVFQAAAVLFAGRLRAVVVRGPFRLADSLGGVALGLAVALAVAWLAAVAALQVPGSSIRRAARDSAILSGLVDAVPPRTVLRTLARFDPLPLIAAPPDLRLPQPDGSLLHARGTEAAAASVVRILSIACGTGVQGSGWVVSRGLVATNAHVIAGAEQTQVAAPSGQVVQARPVYVDAKDDVALLAVTGLRLRSLRVAGELPSEDEVVLLGYPHDGPLTGTAGTAGKPVKVFAPDAYGGRPRLRTVVPLRGVVERGDSGGPVVNADGEVVAMMFAATRNGEGGFGVPVAEVEAGLGAGARPVSPGPCHR